MPDFTRVIQELRLCATDSGCASKSKVLSGHAWTMGTSVLKKNVQRLCTKLGTIRRNNNVSAAELADARTPSNKLILPTCLVTITVS